MITLQKSLTDSKELYLDQYKLLSKLTVVIPSYGRHPYLLRQAAYWRQSGVTVIALDGSIKPLSIDQQKIINAEKNFSYIHMPNGICERLNYAAKLIITPYAVLLGDDDFLLKGGLCSAITRLELDSDYVACTGQAVKFHLSNRNRFVSYEPAYSLWQYSVNGDDGVTRLINAFSKYHAASCYAVARSEVWKSSWGNVQQWAHLPMIELQQAATTYIHGQLTTVDDLYWLRSTERPPVVIGGVWAPERVTLRAWWGSSEFHEERLRYFDLLAQEMVRLGQSDHQRAMDAVQSALALFVAGQDTEHVAPDRWSELNLRVKSLVAQWLRERMTEVEYQKLWRRVGVRLGTAFSTLDELIDGSVPGLLFKLSPQSRSEMREIEKIITRFHANA